MMYAQKFLPHRFQIFNSLKRNFACITVSNEVEVKLEVFEATDAATTDEPLYRQTFTKEQITIEHDSNDPTKEHLHNSRYGPFGTPDGFFFTALLLLIIFTPFLCILVLGLWILVCIVRKCRRIEKEKET